MGCVVEASPHAAGCGSVATGYAHARSLPHRARRPELLGVVDRGGPWPRLDAPGRSLLLEPSQEVTQQAREVIDVLFGQGSKCVTARVEVVRQGGLHG